MLVTLTQTEARDLLEIIEVRHKKASTILSSQLAPAGWHTEIGEDTLADAILDRIVHTHIKSIEGDDSMRKRNGLTHKYLSGLC